MKQVQKTEAILAHMRNSLGEGVDLEALRVYEAIALNTQPIRKRHPLYNGARPDRGMLLEMAAELSTESRPVQIEHNKEESPIGRVFHGEVVDLGTESELRVLFFLDPTANKEATKIEAGSIDQVSVSVVPKQILNSASGFDYLGPNANYEHVMSGTDPDGNTLGENGVYARMVGLDRFFEMSLVGMGGATNARIVARDKSHFGSSYQKLAASGMDPNALVLVASASSRNDNMDLKELVASLTDTKVELSQKATEVATLTQTVTDKDSEIATLTAKLEAANTPDAELTTKVADLTTANETAKANLTAAVDVLKDVATKVLTAAGKDADALPEDVAELNTLINETTDALAASLVTGGRSKKSEKDVKGDKRVSSVGSFRVRR